MRKRKKDEKALSICEVKVRLGNSNREDLRKERAKLLSATKKEAKLWGKFFTPSSAKYLEI